MTTWYRSAMYWYDSNSRSWARLVEQITISRKRITKRSFRVFTFSGTGFEEYAFLQDWKPRQKTFSNLRLAKEYYLSSIANSDNLSLTQ